MSTGPRNAAVKKDWGHDVSGCTILHIDMDAFYASCEVQRRPELAGLPVIIGTGTRSVVSAANYEARTYGVNSAMPVSRARRLCPQGVFLPVDMEYYHAISARVFAIFEEVTDQIEHVSVDECYMDVRAALHLWKSPVAIAHWIRHTVYERLGLTCSVGIAANKLVAKLASTNAKPDGMLLIPAARHEEFVHMMPVRAIPGVGPATQRALDSYGISYVSQLAELDEAAVIRAVGSSISGHTLFLASHGLDERPVVVHAPEKSIGFERTFSEDTRSARAVLDLLRVCCDETASTLRARHLLARTVTLKLRYANLAHVSRSYTMSVPTQSAAVLFSEVKRLLCALLPRASEDEPLGQFIRLAGITTSNLSDAQTTSIQETFDLDFDAPADMESSPAAQSSIHEKSKKTQSTEKALDVIRQRFGKDSVKFGIS
ncbi:DNA polymerase IV [Alloscardovia macacae]|nr:DNA polymerase IV [Alloscardovia macacae]